jgi:hypothetical protein
VSIVTASALLGPVLAFLVALVVAVLIRFVTGTGEPPPLVLVVAGITGQFLRRKVWPRPEAATQSGREPALMNRQPLQLREGDVARGELIPRSFSHRLLAGAAAALGAEALGTAGL